METDKKSDPGTKIPPASIQPGGGGISAQVCWEDGWWCECGL
jgi:hypothetical protein